MAVKGSDYILMEIAEFYTKSKNIIKYHDIHVLMLIFIAAKHASHALPVKALTRLLPQVERRYAQQE